MGGVPEPVSAMETATKAPGRSGRPWAGGIARACSTDRVSRPSPVDDLAAESGLPKDQLLQELSETLPDTVDQLTPDGRIPPPDAL